MYSVLLSNYELGMELVHNDLKKIIKPTDRVVIISWTFPTEIDYETFNNVWFPKYGRRYNKYVTPLLKYGIKEENISILNCYEENKDKFKKIIDDSDILVITGGNPEMLYSKVVQETELLYNIKYYKKLIIGFSAGAELQLKRYFITAKNNYYKYFAFYDGFGVMDDPFYFDVHSINNKFYLDKLKKIALEKKKDVYAIFDDGAIVYDRKLFKINSYGNVIKFNKNEWYKVLENYNNVIKKMLS